MRRINVVLLSAVAFVSALVPWMIVTPQSGAANGDSVHQVVIDRTGTSCASFDDSGNHGSVGVGIAFDGTNLLASCYSDNSVTVNDPISGALVATHLISGASALGALAYDAGRGVLYGCSGFTTAGVVDLATNAFTPMFETAGGGCFDGLAFDAGEPGDAADDTFWASHDVQSSVQHYQYDGTPISSNNVTGEGNVDIGPGNSGIATGGESLFLANNGGQQIYEVAKDFSGGSLFASFERRLEDLECDDVTFADEGIAAMWVIDAYDNLISAFEIPDGSCPFGGGPAECVEDGLAALDPTGVASAVVHNDVEPLVEPLGVDGLVHNVNCRIVVPLEDRVDGLLN